MVDEGGSPNSTDSITVVPDEVRGVGQFVADIARNLRAGLDTAAIEVDALLADGWRGDASDEFGGGWTELRDGGIKILQARGGDGRRTRRSS
ncbi:WXG100 family type VII secretion target [Nocardia grenadensis]|uniref:WXG100 family type VII secretion target n=1 Tax=Nocardia grenadensis TaxID=931537 RepID=UPI003D71ECFA